MKGGTSQSDGGGAGVFGHWAEDAHGLPVFVYTIDHARDPRAAYRTSLGESRDHWHQVGTGAFVSTVHGAGYTQVYDWSRGGKCLNRWSPETGHFAGGFLFIATREVSFCTLWEALPAQATQERRWGCNYAERITRLGTLEVHERIDGNHAKGALEFHWHVRNLGDATLDLRVALPYWPYLQQITPMPLLTHGLRRWADRRRTALSRRFRRQVHPLSTAMAAENAGFFLEFESSRGNINPAQPHRLDCFPPAVIFYALDGAMAQSGIAPAKAFTRDSVSGLPTVLNADALLPVEGASLSEGCALVLTYSVTLAPDASAHASACVDVEHPQDSRAQLAGEPRLPLSEHVRFEVPDHAALGRELTWHAAYLRGAACYSEYHSARFVDQGSAYSYLQGLSGAPRDYCLFILPMVYCDPLLAKDMLRHLFVSQHARSGKLPYATVGHAAQRGYGLHSFSSDLDLFLLWAFGEYLAATRDVAFLDEELPFYPHARGRMGTVLEHVQAAFTHLRDKVGLGPHGLLRCGSGDWNDVLLGYSHCAPLTLLRGESSLNAGLAALALPRLAALLEDCQPELSAELHAFAAAQATALREVWTGRWVARGYLGYLNRKLGEDRIFLDTQSFGVLARVWTPQQEAQLFNAIDALCATPQKVGALALWPPMSGPMLQPGSDTNGGTWAAIDALTAWAWARHAPERAWAFFQGTLLAARANAYPEVWYGVWSGPDSFNAHYHARPGETFLHNFTPMADFPIMNMNRHAGPLLDAIKFAGIEPHGDGMEISPRVPGETFSLVTPLISLHAAPDRISCEYRPIAAATFTFRVTMPSALRGKPYCSQENDAPKTLHEAPVAWHTFQMSGKVGETLRWSISCA